MFYVNHKNFNIDSAKFSYQRYFNHDKIITTWLPYRVNYPKSELSISSKELDFPTSRCNIPPERFSFPHMMLKLLPKLWSIGRGSLSYKSVKVYGMPYLPYDVYLHYLWWFFIICRGYIIIRGDLIIIFVHSLLCVVLL